MIVTEIIDGYKFTFSDSGYQIQKVGTDEIYDSAYDTLDSDYTYVETENLIENNPLNELYLTRGDVFRGLYMAKGITRNQIRAMIEQIPNESERELALIDFDESLNFYRGVPLIDRLGTQLGITKAQMTLFFMTNDWSKLNAN